MRHFCPNCKRPLTSPICVCGFSVNKPKEMPPCPPSKKYVLELESYFDKIMLESVSIPTFESSCYSTASLVNLEDEIFRFLIDQDPRVLIMHPSKKALLSKKLVRFEDREYYNSVEVVASIEIEENRLMLYDKSKMKENVDV